jgi:magnesium transporter
VKAGSGAAVARRLGRRFLDLYPEEAARVLEAVGPAETARVLRARPAARAADVLERLTTSVARDVAAALDEHSAGRVLAQMDPQRAASLLASLPEEARERALAEMPERVVAELRQLMTFPPDSAGALMNPRITMTFRPDQTVRDVVLRLRQIRRRRVNQIYLVDEQSRLIAIIPLQTVILAGARDRLVELSRAPFIAAPVTATREQVIETIAGSTLTALPVVDYEGRLVGAIRQDVLRSTATEEASADIQTMMGVGKDERALSPPTLAVRKRLPWLHLNLLTAFLAASVVGLFENTIARFTALAVLMPVVAGQAGNTGMQALAVTLRGLALREVRSGQWLRIVLKEASVGLFNGLAVAATTSLCVWLWSGSAGLTLVIGLAIVLSMAIASLVGAAIPLVLAALGQDPAQASSILLTTVTDVLGFFSFLGLATLFSRLL